MSPVPAPCSLLPLPLPLALPPFIPTPDSSLLSGRSLLGPFRVVGGDLDLDEHMLVAQPGDADRGPEGLVVGHPLAEVAHHGAHGLLAERDVVRGDAEHLAPALAARRAQRQVHVCERLVDLLADVARHVGQGAFGLPSAWEKRVVVAVSCLLCPSPLQ